MSNTASPQASNPESMAGMMPFSETMSQYERTRRRVIGFFAGIVACAGLTGIAWLLQ